MRNVIAIVIRDRMYYMETENVKKCASLVREFITRLGAVCGMTEEKVTAILNDKASVNRLQNDMYFATIENCETDNGYRYYSVKARDFKSTWNIPDEDSNCLLELVREGA